MDSFPTFPPTSLSSSGGPTPQGVHLTNVPRIHVTDDRMAEILLQMENVLNISNTSQALSESLRIHVNGVAGENRPILQPQIEVPEFTKQQCNEATAVITEDIRNLACWGCSDTCNYLFTCPYLKKAQSIFFSYRYFRHHVAANPIVSKLYMENDAHRAGSGQSPHGKYRQKSSVRSEGHTADSPTTVP